MVDDNVDSTETSPVVVRRVYRHVNPKKPLPMAKDVANMLTVIAIAVKRKLGEGENTSKTKGSGSGAVW